MMRFRHSYSLGSRTFPIPAATTTRLDVPAVWNVGSLCNSDGHMTPVRSESRLAGSVRFHATLA
jgi:hypothetical protein